MSDDRDHLSYSGITGWKPGDDPGPFSPAASPEAVALNREAVKRVVAVCAFGYSSGDAEIGARDLGWIGATVDAILDLVRSESVVKAEALREAADQVPGPNGRRWLLMRADELENEL